MECELIVTDDANTPSDWANVSLYEIAELVMGQSPPSTTYNESGFGLPFFQGTKDFNYMHPTPRVYCSAPTRIAESGDILLSIRAPIGRVNVADRRCAIGRGLAIIRPKPGVDARFVEFLLRRMEPTWNAMNESGTVFGNATKRDLQSMPIDLPPLPEQRRIAHILGTLDDKIELNRRMNETLEEMARAVFKDWFVDFGPVRAKTEGLDAYLPEEIWGLFPDRLVESELGLVPDGWGVKRLGEVVQVNPRRSLTKGTVAPYLAMANMPTKGHSPIEVVDRPFGSGMRYKNGDTLVARITPCLENGKTAYVDFLNDGQIGWGSTEYVVLRPTDPIPPQFAYCLARSTDFRDFAVHNMSGTSGRQRVSGDAISSYLLAVPDDLGIPEAFGRLVEPLFVLASENARQSRTLADHRDAMLPVLVSGTLDVDPNRIEKAKAV